MSSKHVSVIGLLQIRLPCKYSSVFSGIVAEKAMANIQDVPNKCIWEINTVTSFL